MRTYREEDNKKDSSSVVQRQRRIVRLISGTVILLASYLAFTVQDQVVWMSVPDVDQNVLDSPLIMLVDPPTKQQLQRQQGGGHHHPNEEETKKARLRYDWTNLDLRSPIAWDLYRHQSNCSLPLWPLKYRNRFGLGSDLHVWGQSLCHGMEQGVRARTLFPWTFWDEEACSSSSSSSSSSRPIKRTKRDSTTNTTNSSSISPMLCYFQNVENLCPQDAIQVFNKSQLSNPLGYKCPKTMQDYSPEFQVADFRAAGTEFLFSRVSSLVVEEAQRQLKIVFPPHGLVPPGLITVHMRWGDKKFETKLRKVSQYLRAVKTILWQQKEPTDVHIFLATEDPRAVQEFQDGAPEHWKIHVDHYFTEMLPYRVDEYNGNPKMSKALKGRAGLVALGSLLVAMEANHFVLTTASNWSRLMNELRKNILNPRCNNCTTMVDLKPGEW